MHVMQVPHMHEAPGLCKHREVSAKAVHTPEAALTTQDTAGNKQPRLNPCSRQKLFPETPASSSGWSF